MKYYTKTQKLKLDHGLPIYRHLTMKKYLKIIFLSFILAGCAPQSKDIFKAISKGDIIEVKKLAAHKKLLNSRESETQMTPLISAIINNKTDIAIMLMKLGADITLTDDCNVAPFSWASHTRNLKIMKYIYKNYPGVDINHVDSFTDTPLIIAVKKNYNEVVAWLSSLHGIKFNMQTKKGVAALSQAAYWGNLDMVKTLVSNGAEINLVNIKGQTILDFALERLKDNDWPENNKVEFKEVIKYLKAHGAKTAAELKKEAIN